MYAKVTAVTPKYRTMNLKLCMETSYTPGQYNDLHCIFMYMTVNYPLYNNYYYALRLIK